MKMKIDLNIDIDLYQTSFFTKFLVFFQGDSGGPLLVDNGGDKYEIVGEYDTK